MLSEKLIGFYKELQPPANLPKGIEVLFPQKDPLVIEIVGTFFRKYFNDDRPRGLLLGINPGRYGAGLTGVNFTAPKQLKEYCKIDHHLKLSSELSAEFIYEMIMAYGGVQKFYQDWCIGSVCPLGFTASSNPSKVGASGRNMNYYDDKELAQAVTPFIIQCINKQVAMGFKTNKCFCIGGEKNFKFLLALNHEYKWFEEIVPLPHPRFILQYRRKQKDFHIHQYLSALRFAG
ncbi:MAG TPA: uracil-DNA glycosylase family protein [Chitinophagaceae bacterium]|nr:uracil-DNA glycosylase family protein [Chitinophagaceae bacterium]